MSRYVLLGGRTGEPLSFGGKVLVHTDRNEMEWLFPKTRVIRITDGDFGQPTMRLQDHPDLRHVRFPLRREDFT